MRPSIYFYKISTTQGILLPHVMFVIVTILFPFIGSLELTAIKVPFKCSDVKDHQHDHIYVQWDPPIIRTHRYFTFSHAGLMLLFFCDVGTIK